MSDRIKPHGKHKTPAANWRPGRCELRERLRVRSISADVDGAQAIAEPRHDRARHKTSVVAIAAADVADAEAVAPVMMIAPPAAPSTATAERLRGSNGGSERHRAERSCGNKSMRQFTKHGHFPLICALARGYPSMFTIADQSQPPTS